MTHSSILKTLGPTNVNNRWVKLIFPRLQLKKIHQNLPVPSASVISGSETNCSGHTSTAAARSPATPPHIETRKCPKAKMLSPHSELLSTVPRDRFHAQGFIPGFPFCKRLLKRVLPPFRFQRHLPRRRPQSSRQSKSPAPHPSPCTAAHNPPHRAAHDRAPTAHSGSPQPRRRESESS